MPTLFDHHKSKLGTNRMKTSGLKTANSNQEKLATMITANEQHIILPAFVEGVTEKQQVNQGLFPRKKADLLQPLRNRIDSLEIENRKFAKLIAKLIPAQCPFERDITFLGRKIAHIPPMCKLNPLYDEFVGLRFRALCYLVDECGEDIQSYC
jgi:Mo-dependent nitrogenase C-terminus